MSLIVETYDDPPQSRPPLHEVVRHRLEPARPKRADVFSLLLFLFQYNDAELAAMREVKNRFDPR
jgi:hypothetical protein